jgi:hypothetical protein
VERRDHIGVVGGILLDGSKEDDSGEYFDLYQSRVQLLAFIEAVMDYRVP